MQISVEGISLEILDIPAAQISPSDAVLVLLHEGLGCVALWRTFPQRLAEATGLRVVAYSRAGYGQSTPHPNGARHVNDARYMHRQATITAPQVLAALNITRPILIGHSDGATIALIFAAAFPDALAGCVVMAPHSFVEPIAIARIAQAKKMFETAELAAKLSKYHKDSTATFWSWNDVWLSSDFLAFNIEVELSRIKSPLLAIQGENDEYGTMRQIEVIEQAIPAAQILKLADCGHAPWQDCADVVLEATRLFVTGIVDAQKADA